MRRIDEIVNLLDHDVEKAWDYSSWRIAHSYYLQYRKSTISRRYHDKENHP